MKGHYTNILVPTDFSEQSLFALEQAYALAKLLNVEITLLHVIPEGGTIFPFGLLSKEPTEKEKADYDEACFSRLQEISQKEYKKSWIKVNPLLLHGKVHEKILEFAKDIYARFIVIGTNSSDPIKKKYFIGSTTSKVLNEAACPILTVNGSDVRENFETIILPLDLSKQTVQKVSKAIDIAKYYNSTIRVVSILLTDEPAVVKQITQQLDEVKIYIQKRDIYVTGQIIRGDKIMGSLSSFVLDYAYEVDGDLIMIVTNQEINKRSWFLGSNDVDIVSDSKIPVLSVVPK